MSKWHEFYQCGNCMYMSSAENETGFGCYRDNEAVYPVTPNRPACRKHADDLSPRAYMDDNRRLYEVYPVHY